MKKHSRLGFSLIELSVVILVIGILVIGITKGSRIITEAKLKSARSLTASSPVNSTEGLVFWLDSASEKSFDAIAEGGSIANWYDLNPQSTIKNNAIQATQSKQPTYRSNIIGGLPTVYFDGINDVMATSTINSAALSKNGQVTIFLVAKYITGAATSVLYKFESGADRIGLEINTPFRNIRFDAINGASGQLVGTVNIANRATVMVFDKNYTTQSIFINNATAADVTLGNALSFVTNFNATVKIGANTDASGYPTNIYIAELMTFNRSLTINERTAIVDYLKNKWGIKS